MATVEQVLIRKAEELQAQLSAIRTTLALLQRQPSRNGGPMVADVRVAHGQPKKQWRQSTVGQSFIDAVVQTVQRCGARPVQIVELRKLLSREGTARGPKALTIALHMAVEAGLLKRPKRGWYEATT